MLAQRDTNTMLHRQEILFVDDIKGVREGWRRLLTTDERRVTTAADGDSAIRGLMGHPVDLVISDLRMPGADGLELLEWIHNNEPDTPFVLVTGFGSPEVEEKARQLGAYGYLEKPVSPDELEEIALAALRGDQSSWAHAVVADDPALESELAKPCAPALQLVSEKEEVAAVETAEVQPGSLRQLMRLMVSPLIGLAYIMFLPVIGIAAAVYGIGMLVAKVFRPAVVTGIETSAVVSEEERVAVVAATTFDPGSLRDFGRLVVAPFKGLAYIVCLPLIIFSTVAYGVSAKIVKVFRLASIR